MDGVDDITILFDTNQKIPYYITQILKITILYSEIKIKR